MTDNPPGESPTNGSHRPPLDGELTSIPLLIGNVDLTAGTAPSRASADGYGGGQGAGATVAAAIRDVLGYRTRATDAKGFQTALQRSFTCSETAGHTVCTWTHRSYAATIPADLGALTGAQASLYNQAKNSADVILPLLAALTPLRSNVDYEDAEAIRSIVRSRVVAIVEEMGLEGGPRVQRVDELFDRLTKTEPDTLRTLPRQVKGELRTLGKRFGMTRWRVNTLSEEENFTNYIIIVDNVVMMAAAWYTAKDYFAYDLSTLKGDDGRPFLGTQLVLLSRQLNVIAETVNECYFAMDTVFLGQAERQTVLLDLENKVGDRTKIFVSELLDWITRFSTDEGPQLIEDAGTDGVNAFRPTVQRLARLARSAANLKIDGEHSNGLPPSFFTKRVKSALEQLASQLTRTEELAAAVIDRLKIDDDQKSTDKHQGDRR